jgi:hypothetical protein
VDRDLELRSIVYRHFAEHATAPTLNDMVDATGHAREEIREAYQRLYAKRMLVPMPDGEHIRMAPPFSGVATQHRVEVNGREYYANCAWDSFGIPAALHVPAHVLSRCEQTLDPLSLRLSHDGPWRSSWVFHVVVPAAQWWRDIVYT